ncbi:MULTISPECIES: hypothetical protein [Achromobacter]|uniref:hypothetical protein n=1 Tax=Achromobacter TaxID=222 RepID=UPI0023F64536|nr:hypothetical protein [Achromobacter anxifer]MDF8363291.1 hypothetical protein [Achromobacter anxifer]
MTLNVRMNPTATVVGNLEMTSGSEVPHIRDMRFHFERDAPAPGQAAVIQAVWDSERWLWAVSQWQPLEAVESSESAPEKAAVVEAVETLPAHEQAATTHSDREEPEPSGAAAPDVTPPLEATSPVRQESAQRKVFAFGEKNPSAQAKAHAPKAAAEPKTEPTENQTPDAPAVANSRDSAAPRPGFVFGQKPSQTAPSSAPRRMYTPPRPTARPVSAQQSASATANTIHTAAKPASSATPASQSRQPLNAMQTQAKATVPVRVPQQVGGASRRGGFGMGPAETHAAANMPAPFPPASAEARGTLNASDSDDRLSQWGMNPADDFSDLIPF